MMEIFWKKYENYRTIFPPHITTPCTFRPGVYGGGGLW